LSANISIMSYLYSVREASEAGIMYITIHRDQSSSLAKYTSLYLVYLV